MLARFIFIFAASISLVRSSGAAGTYCNPLDLDYRYNFEEKWRNISYRVGADPVIINHQGEYFLFGTIQDGYWHSKNLRDWRHVKPEGWPQRDVVAPAALSAKGKLWLFPSTYEQRPIYTVTDPGGEHPRLETYNDQLPYLPGLPGPWDPALFFDQEKDAWYMYFGSSNFYPLGGIQLDEARKLSYIGTARELISLHPDAHGWERFGRDHRDTIKPFIEGAWMTKHAGKYYLQYAAPGTEHNVYANGTYVGDGPLGPFVYAPNNPISYKPGGFLQGAGHGNTFADRFGNFWNTGTPWVAVNYDFERRIAMFPARFDNEGLLYASTRFGDFPQNIPTSKWENADSLFTGWMLLSYKKPAIASSVFYPFAAAHVTDENPRTFWLAGTNRAGEELTVDLAHVCDVRAVQVNFTDYKSGLFESGPEVFTQFRLHGSEDGRNWKLLADVSREKRDRPNAYIELPNFARARFIRYEHIHVGSRNLAISDLRVFGTAGGSPPKAPENIAVRRDSDPRNAFVSWSDVPSAVGYNIRWGIAPEKLYSTYQVFADQRTQLELRALSAGQGYLVAVEAFDENGVSPLSKVLRID